MTVPDVAFVIGRGQRIWIITTRLTEVLIREDVQSGEIVLCLTRR